MTNAKHTPGPWWYRDRMVLTEARGEYVCEVFGAASNEQHQADARLIAAAPDLYETCVNVATEMRRHIDSLRSITGFPDLTPKQCKWASDLERAIAKVEGREP